MSQVDEGNDLEMMSKVSIGETIESMLPEYVEIFQEQSQCGMEDPLVEMVFSTVHKFKGQEMDTVRLLDVFIFLGIPYGKPVQGRIEVD